MRPIRSPSAAALLLFTLFAISSPRSLAADDLHQASYPGWAWMGGSQTGAATGDWGSPGIASPSNIPSGRFGFASWTDEEGNFWIFGGKGLDAAGNRGDLNDLWRFDPRTSQWTWLSGSCLVPDSIVDRPTLARYGTKGAASALNTPGGRWLPSAWADHRGNLWLFGGSSRDASKRRGFYNDLWKYQIRTNQWTWVDGGNELAGDTDGLTSNVYPVGRFGAATWVDAEGDLWMFGGLDSYAQGPWRSSSFLNELWKYSPASGQWKMVSGTNLPNQLTIPGTLNVPSPTNMPGGRTWGYTWIDRAGKLWLFGGLGYNSISIQVCWMQDDLWSYDPSTNEWTWVSGIVDAQPNVGWKGLGTYGQLGVPAISNLPGSHIAGVSYLDKRGNFWLVGGDAFGTWPGEDTFTDLWKYVPSSDCVPGVPCGSWIWMAGADLLDFSERTRGTTDTPVFGNLGEPDGMNVPGGREQFGGFVDKAGNLWLFGGYGYDLHGEQDTLNDLWKFAIVE